MNFKEYLKYDTSSPSCLRWVVTLCNRAPAGSPVGSIGKKGYYKTSIDKRFYLIHRIVWEMHNGEIPEGLMVDHKDRNKTNNCIDNLRLASNSQNQKNRYTKCYTYNKASGKWRVFLSIDKVQVYFGSFEDESTAKSESERLKLLHYKEFAPNG